jgi:hypothetical protein
MAGKIKTRRYTEADKDRAAVMLLIHGNPTAVADACGIPGETVRFWARQPEWAERMARVRHTNVSELDAYWTRYLPKAMEAMFDRLENGDWKAIPGKDESGAPVAVRYRLPMSARDIAITMAIVFDKRQIIRNLPTSIRGQSGEDRWKDLARGLEQLAGRGRLVEGEQPAQISMNKAEQTDKT